MEAPSKRDLIIAVVALGVGFGVCYGVMPKKIEVREKIVEKKVEQTEKQRDREVIKVQVKKPDGTVETRTELRDKKVETAKTETEKSQEKEKVVTRGSGLGVQFFVRGPLNQPVYGAGVYKKFFGPVSIGVFGFTDKVWGLSAGLEF